MTHLLPTSLGLLLQSTALLLLGLLVLRLTRHCGPALQSLIGRATLAGVALALLLAGPLTGHIRPLWRVTIPVAAAITKEPAPPQVALAEPNPAYPSPAHPVRESENLKPGHDSKVYGEASYREGATSRALKPGVFASSPARLRGVAASGGGAGSLACSLMAATWGLGTALLLLWLGICQWHLTRLRRGGCPIVSGPAAELLATLTPRPPALLAHPSVRSPFLAGLCRPAIFLPVTYVADFDTTALRAILVHELAHIARRDNAWTLAARLLCALLWPQPFLWLLCRRLEQIGEEACDQTVLAQDCSPRAYADCLLTLAERHPLGRRERALGAGVAPFRSSLGRRIARILDKGTYAMSAVTPRLRLTITALSLAAALGGAFLVSSAPAQSPSPAPITLSLEQQRYKAARSQDQTNLKQIGLALIQYAQDHNDVFPNAAHWMDALSPYLKDKAAFFDPFQSGARRYAYALNRNCAGKSLAAFAYPAETVFVFDSTLGTRNASDTGQSLRTTAAGANSGSDYLFVDGHVKWFRKTYRPPFALNQRMSRPQADKSHISQLYIGNKPVGPARVTIQSITELSNARFLAGLTPVQGPGVVVTLNDSRKRLPAMPSGVAPPNIIHDTDINQVVNELKAAGAEAIAVNGQRLVAVSPIRCTGPTIFVNSIPQVPPYVIKAIGNPKTLAAFLTMRGGIATQLKAYDPAMFSIREGGTMRLPAYFDLDTPRYAKPVPNDAQTRRQAIDLSKQGTTELKSLATRLDAENTSMEAKLTTLRREDEGNRDQEAALGKASHTIAELQTIDRQCALLQLRILLNTQGNQTASRRADTNATQQALRALRLHRAQVAQTLPLRQERDFEAKSRSYERRGFPIGIDIARLEVAQAENRRQYRAVETRLETSNAQTSGMMANR